MVSWRPLRGVASAALTAGLVTAIAVVAFVGIRYATHAERLGRFAVAGAVFVHPGAPADLPVTSTGTGYDGQFYYRLALDPFTRARTADGITLDNPPYRQQRIGLPLAAYALRRLAGLRTSLALVGVNAAGVLALGAAGGAWARRLGRPALWGVLLAATPAVVIALARDLTEPLATAALLIGLYAWAGRRRPVAALAFTAAILTRETVFVPLLGLAVSWIVRGARDRASRPEAARAVGWLCLPAAVELAWQLYLGSVWGHIPMLSNSGDLGPPFYIVVRSFFGGASHIGLSHAGLLELLWIGERVALLALLVTAAAGLRRSTLDADVRLAWVFAALLAVSTPWHQDGFVRACNEAIVLGQLVLLSRPDRAAARVLRLSGLWSAAVAVVYAVSL